VAVAAKDVTDSAALKWMIDLDPKLLALEKGLRAGPNLGTLLAGQSGTGPPDAAAARQLLGLIPPAFAAAVITPDRTRSELSYGVPRRSAAEQAKLVDRVQDILDGAPTGVTAEVSGLMALSGAGANGLQNARPWLLLLAAGLIFGLLYAVRRRWDRALIPFLPTLLATGAAAVIVELAGVTLAPLSAGLDPLMLAIGAGFGLLLEARYWEERRDGRSPEDAARTAAERLGASVGVAAGTVALGFGVLALSSLSVLQQFGVIAPLELIVSVTASIALVPGLTAAADRAAIRRAGVQPPASSMLTTKEVV
jgi:predicted RND superfamily exporter protein